MTSTSVLLSDATGSLIGNPIILVVTLTGWNLSFTQRLILQRCFVESIRYVVKSILNFGYLVMGFDWLGDLLSAAVILRGPVV